MPAMLARQRPRLGDACHGGKMATLLTSLFFMFKMLFLYNYCIKYYDYIVKWCSGVACNWWVSLAEADHISNFFMYTIAICIVKKISICIKFQLCIILSSYRPINVANISCFLSCYLLIVFISNVFAI